MPGMGRPATAGEQRFNQVQIGPKKSLNSSKNDSQEREKLLNRLSGYKPKDDLYVDGKSHNKMGKDEFLKLLTHQLQNQDPMEPMKQDKMAADLAQFSQLEQLSNLNAQFKGLTENKVIESKFYGASFLGKEVVTQGQSVDFKGLGTESQIYFNLEKPAPKVLIRMLDNNNNIVAELWKENVGQGSQGFKWDGESLDGTTQPAGQYKLQVAAWDESANPMPVKTQTVGKVESVLFEEGETVLLVEGKKVFLRDVDSFHMPKNKGQKVAQALANSFNQPAASALIKNDEAKKDSIALRQEATVESKSGYNYKSVYDE